MVLWQGEKRKRAAEGIVSVLLSVLTVFAGTAYQQYAGVPEGSRKVIYLFLQILLWTVLYFAGFRITEGVLKKKETSGREEYTLHFSAGRQMIGLVLCWLPYLLIYAPGLVNFDTINQINDFYDGISPVWFGFVEGQETVVALLNDHHPVFVTVLFSLIMLPWKAAGYPAGGIFCYCLLQMIFGAWVFVGFLSALKRWGLWFSGVDAICCFIYGYDAEKYIAWDYFCLVFMEAAADASRRRWQEGNEVVLADFGAVVPYTENRNLSCCPDRSGIAVS